MYGDIAKRYSSDVDLFFDIMDFDKVFNLMISHGFRPETYSTPQYLKKVKRESAEYNFEKYDREDKILHFEFHWKMGSSFHCMGISINDLSSQIVSGQLNGKEIKVFTPSANLLLTVMHHGGKDPFVRLKHVLDIGYLLQKDIDWEWVLIMAKRFDIEKLIYLAVSLSNVFVGTEVPPVLLNKTESNEIKKLTGNRIEAILKTHGMEGNTGYYYDRLVFQLTSRTRFLVKLCLVVMNIKAFIFQKVLPERVKRVYLRKRFGIFT